MHVAVDFETSYDKSRDIKTLGVVAYLRHPETDIYMVSLFGEGIEYVGPPEEAPWDRIADRPWVSHNRSFDLAVYRELVRRGIVSEPLPPEWHCTADMSVYLQGPRPLANAMKEFEGILLDKGVRDDMKGKDWHALSDAKKQEVLDYALDDAKASWLLWDKCGPKWPAHERRLSRLTTEMCHYGIGFDHLRANEYESRLTELLFEIEKAIPWAGELNERGKPVPLLSPLRLGAECRKLGIPVPDTTDSKSEVFDEWADQYADKAPFVACIQRYRKANRLLRLVQAMKARTAGDPVLYYGLKYGGAVHTMRWSGDAGVNVQNLSRTPFEGIDTRSLLVPRPGHKFIIADLSQIEAITLRYLAGDHLTMKLLREGMDLYEIHARTTKGYTDPRPLKDVDKGLRQACKVEVLGLGFGMGPGKFQTVYKQWTGQDIPASKAEQVVKNFRSKNPKIVAMWKELDRAIRGNKKDGETVFTLPSGRRIEYFNVREYEGDWSAQVERGGYAKKVFGGLAAENVTQGTARDVLAENLLRLDDAGYRVVLHVHDEVVVEVPESEAQAALPQVEKIMSTPPDWAPDLPVSTEAAIHDRYTK